MDATTLQAKIYGGYAQAAKRLGTPCGQYRPLSALGAALDPANLLRALSASFSPGDADYGAPSAYGKATWRLLADGSLLAVGDYLARPGGGVFFIAGLEPLLPILAVACNRVAGISRPQRLAGAGAAPYGGDTVAGETPLVVQFPLSILQGAKGGKSPVSLPGDVRTPWWTILLPALPGGVVLRGGDVIADDLERRYVISSAEAAELGWRITATQAET